MTPRKRTASDISALLLDELRENRAVLKESFAVVRKDLDYCTREIAELKQHLMGPIGQEDGFLHRTRKQLDQAAHFRQEHLDNLVSLLRSLNETRERMSKFDGSPFVPLVIEPTIHGNFSIHEEHGGVHTAT